MKYDTVIQMPIANTTGAVSGAVGDSPVQDESEKLSLLALLSNKDPSGEPESPDSSISAGESSFAGSTGTNPIQPDPTADDSPAENSEKNSEAPTVFPLLNAPKLPAEKPADPLEAIRALAPEVAYHMRKLLESTKTPASVKLRVLEIILERTYGKVETAVKLSSNAHQSVEASQARIAAMVEKIRFEGEQIRLVFDEGQ